MDKYSRYGSYFLANEDGEEIVIKAKPSNRKRHDFVSDTDPNTFADNIDENIPEEIGDAPEGFPMGDISDEPDDPSDNLEPFPGEENIGDEDELPEFPGEDKEDISSNDNLNTDDELPEFPTGDEGSDNLDNISDFPTDDNTPSEGEIDNDSRSSSDNNTSSDIGSTGDIILNDFKKQFGDKLPTPDEIIEDLRKKVYGDNPPEATQNNDNNSDIPPFPDESNQATTNTVTNDEGNIPPFPGDEPNPMDNTPDTMNADNTPPFPGDNANTPNEGDVPPFPGNENTGEVITPNGVPDAGGNTDFTSGSDTGTPPINGQAPQQQQGPGVGYDSMRKYNLYKEFDKLLNAIDNYINKLKDIIFDEPHQNLIVKTVTDKLYEVRSLCYDFINMKFEVVYYTQAYVFFEELTVSIQVIFSLLMSISSYNNTEEDKKKKSNKSSKDTK